MMERVHTRIRTTHMNTTQRLKEMNHIYTILTITRICYHTLKKVTVILMHHYFLRMNDQIHNVCLFIIYIVVCNKYISRILFYCISNTCV